MTVTDAGVELGASITLTRLQELFQGLITTRPSYQTSGLRAVVEQLRWFAGRQIRNVGTLGGNIVTASPISDLNPLWMAMGADFIVVGPGGKQRSIPASNFFLAYRKVDMAPEEVLLKVVVPWTRRFEFVKEFKQAPRRDDDIAIVNAGMRVKLAPAAAAEGKGWWVGRAGTGGPGAQRVGGELRGPLQSWFCWAGGVGTWRAVWQPGSAVTTLEGKQRSAL